MRRRRIVAAIGLLVPVAALAAIAEPPAASRGVRHRLTEPQLFALAGARLGSIGRSAAIAADFKRLLADRYDRFMINLGDEVPMRRVGDAVMGEGTRPDSLGYEASLFVLGRRGEMFAVVKGGAYGVDIAQFGDTGLLRDWNVRHRYLEFVDLDE